MMVGRVNAATEDGKGIGFCGGLVAILLLAVPVAVWTGYLLGVLRRDDRMYAIQDIDTGEVVAGPFHSFADAQEEIKSHERERQRLNDEAQKAAGEDKASVYHWKQNVEVVEIAKWPLVGKQRLTPR